MKEIKCPNCKIWNKDVDNCAHCGTPISAKQLNINYRKQIEEEDSKRPPSKFETFLAKHMKSKNVVIKSFSYLVFSIWVVYMTILGFFLYIIVGTPG